jgi:hypothetical protein
MAQKHTFQILDADIAYVHDHPNAKSVAQRALMFGEAALLFASTPGGFQAGQRLLFRQLAPKRSPLSAGAIKAAIRRFFGAIA